MPTPETDIVEPTARDVLVLADILTADERFIGETGSKGRFSWATYVAFARACLRAGYRATSSSRGDESELRKRLNRMIDAKVAYGRYQSQAHMDIAHKAEADFRDLLFATASRGGDGVREALQDIVNALDVEDYWAATQKARAALSSTVTSSGDEQCERCQGNGEIVVDWENYMHPSSRAAEEASVAECPDCDGIGRVHPAPAAPLPSGGDGIERGAIALHLHASRSRRGRAGWEKELPEYRDHIRELVRVVIAASLTPSEEQGGEKGK